MKSLSIIACGLLVGWYIAAGIQITEYTVARIEARCPGHRHAYDRWPTAFWIFSVSAWPLGVYVNAFPRIGEPVCDRFD